MSAATVRSTSMRSATGLDLATSGRAHALTRRANKGASVGRAQVILANCIQELNIAFAIGSGTDRPCSCIASQMQIVYLHGCGDYGQCGISGTAIKAAMVSYAYRREMYTDLRCRVTMKLTNEFVVPVSIEETWDVLQDLEAIAPCLPGAQVESVDGDDYLGVVKVKLGPVSPLIAEWCPSWRRIRRSASRC